MDIHPQISDEKLRFEVLAALEADHRIAKNEISVGVLNGTVHLAGRVYTQKEWAIAEKIAQSVDGVRGVVNRIEAPGAPSPGRKINLKLDGQ